MKPIDKLSEEQWSALVQRAVALADAPEAWIQRALALWREQDPQERPLLQRMAAVLRFDSWSGAAVAAGMRALPSEVRQLLFEAPACDIDLRIVPQAEGFAIAGQLLGPGGDGFVEVVGPEGEPTTASRSVALDTLGEFRIERIRRGRYLVAVRLGRDRIELPPIDIGPSRDSGAT